MIGRTIAAALAAALAASLAATPALAQHAFASPTATFDSRVPTPQAVFGYALGDRFTNHQRMLRSSSAWPPAAIA